MYYQQGVFNCDYCIKTNLDIQKHMKFATLHPAHFCKTALIFDLLNTNFKLNQAVISGMVTCLYCGMFLITANKGFLFQSSLRIKEKNLQRQWFCVASCLSCFVNTGEALTNLTQRWNVTLLTKIAIKLLLKVF